ncbi:alpha/beta hydrolase [bacterium]|nr:alpha/beta hydrolase [bacterium]
MTTKYFEVKQKARVVILGNPESQKRLYALHGYGQLATYFSRKFEPLVEEGWCVVVPEGMHRFYLEGFSGRVGASWMTKEDRLVDIDNYVAQLNTIHGELPQISSAYLLGFSQGVATAFRWLFHSEIHFKQLIMCSGMIPPEIELELNTPKFKDLKYDYISGNKDPFRDSPEVLEFVQKLKKFDLNIRHTEFEGAHTVHYASVHEALIN